MVHALGTWYIPLGHGICPWDRSARATCDLSMGWTAWDGWTGWMEWTAWTGHLWFVEGKQTFFISGWFPEMKKVCFPSTNHTWESMQSMPCSPCHVVHPMQSTMQTMLHVRTCPRGMYHVPRACTMSQGHVPCPKAIYHIQRLFFIKSYFSNQIYSSTI